ELLALVLSISALITVLFLLPFLDNKPLSAWKFPISLNTIISILGATSRAALAFAVSACISQGKWNWYKRGAANVMTFDRFEEASRGPWGSLRLLWNIKLKHWTALGALSAVSLVGFEPFLQAIITLPGEQMEITGAANDASIGRTEKLDAGLLGMLSVGARQSIPMPEPWGAYGVYSIRSVPDFGAIAAIWEGFSNESSINNLKPAFNCPTGNCTWPPYASLAVCSKCYDISKQMKRSHGQADLSDDVMTMNETFSSTFSRGNYTRYDLPVQRLSISNFNGDYKETPSARLTARATCRPDETVSFRNLRTLLISFAVMQPSQSYFDLTQDWEHNKVTSTECALYFCTSIYQSRVEKGVLLEKILGSPSNRNVDSFLSLADEAAKAKAWNEYQNYTLLLLDGSSDVEHSDLQLSIPGEDFHAVTGVYTDHDLHFNITHGTVSSLLGWMLRTFSQRPGELRDRQLIYPYHTLSEDQPPVIESLGNSRNILETFDIAAASLTRWMRDRSHQADPFFGTTKQWTIKIRVNWTFTLLPIGALLGGCVFCLLSVLDTRRLGLPPWRGNSLVTLAHGLDTESRALLRGTDDGDQISTRARQLDVVLVDSDGGRELVQR
ncbi:hypothetical protein LX32DRAFT_508608, partial [Colletotrichum zoysiae]